MLSIFCPYRGRPDFYRDFIFHYHYYFPDAYIYLLEQDDGKLFRRGQLMNAAFQHLVEAGCLLEDILFVDVDIRLRYPIPFEGLLREHQAVIIPFNQLDLFTLRAEGEYVSLDKPSYFLSQPDGGVTLFTRDMFLACNGFSNLYIGWGREDSDFVRRNERVVRVPNQMIHLEHPRKADWDTDAFRRNDTNFQRCLDPALDGVKQTQASFRCLSVQDRVFHCKIKDISVVDDYQYREFIQEGIDV